MLDSPSDRAAEPVLQALPVCTSHLTDDEVYEVCARGGGEAELNDLLRHAMNRIVRPMNWLVRREWTQRELVTRADLFMAEASGEPFAVIEAKMFYATDAVDIPNNYRRSMGRDVAKLRLVQERMPMLPVFLLAWVPYFPEVRRPLRYMKGHDEVDGKRVSKYDLASTRDATRTILRDVAAGADGTLVEVRRADGEDGSVILDAHLVPLTLQ